MSQHLPTSNQMSLPGIKPEAQDNQAQTLITRNGSKNLPSQKAGPVNLGKPVQVRVPDFSAVSRPKTCLEVDFPIVPINQLSALEGNAGKPIYQMSKWWARRHSSVFRAMLIAASMEAPTRTKPDGAPITDETGLPIPDETEAALAVWNAYYSNHQRAGHFRHLRVLDCFMGGGTTLVEASRLGFNVTGVDLNPVAWFVVKNEMACTDPSEVRRFFDQIKSEVNPVIQPFYVTDCPRGHKGQWFKVSADGNPTHDQPMPNGFDPLEESPEQRRNYRYEGPEVIYTFWAKHGQCLKPGCGHRTPLFRSPVIAEKKLGVKYIELTCKSCKTMFHAELGSARMAPEATRVVLPTELPFAELSQPFAKLIGDYSRGNKEEKQQRVEQLYSLVHSEPGFLCPKCGHFAGEFVRDVLEMHRRATRVSTIDKKHLRIQPPRNRTKPVYSYLLVDPQWLKGAPGGQSGSELGGHPDASPESTAEWYEERLKSLSVIEVRGRIKLSEDVSVPSGQQTSLPSDQEPAAPDEAEVNSTPEQEEPDRKEYGLPRYLSLKDGRVIDTKKGTIPKNSHFTCGRCGNEQDFREATESSSHAAPVAIYAVQSHCSCCEAEGYIYGGRAFQVFDRSGADRISHAEREWYERRDSDLKDYWPKDEIPYSYMTHHANFALPKQGYTHWWKMFNARQLLTHAALLKAIESTPGDQPVREQALGAFQQYLRMQNMFVIWHQTYDKIAPFLSNPNYAPKARVVENNLYGRLGYGTWESCSQTVIDGLTWCQEPEDPFLQTGATAHSIKVKTGDRVAPGAELHCCSSSDLSFCDDQTFDLVITDPPFGDNIFYSDLANFFYAWLRLPLKQHYPDLFKAEKTPNAQEALTPRLLPEDEANEYYQTRLTACWTHAARVLKDGGLMAFTFHHSEDSQWAIVLKSLFDAGFVLEQTFPIVSDEQKGEGGQFGAKGTEYDMIHVCRKRLEEPTPVSWPKMRQWVKAELTRLRKLLEAYKAADLPDADIRVILRGKALEFYSRHYGQVFTLGAEGAREALSIGHALAGINQLLDEGTGEDANRPPAIVQPIAYQYLRLFGNCTAMPADDVSKSLFGTTIRQRDFEDRGWIREHNRRVETVSIRERFEYCRRRPRKEMKTEIDQAHFLIGAAILGSGVNLEQELSKDTWIVRPTVAAVLDWYGKASTEPGIAHAASLSAQILRRTLEKLRAEASKAEVQLTLFEEWNEV